MKVVIDISDRLVDSAKALMSLFADDEDGQKELIGMFDSMKGSEVGLDLSKAEPQKAKEFSIGIVMMAATIGEIKKKDGD